MDRLRAGHAGHPPDTRSSVWDAQPGQDRTHPLRVSVCPASVRSKVDERGRGGTQGATK